MHAIPYRRKHTRGMDATARKTVSICTHMHMYTCAHSIDLHNTERLNTGGLQSTSIDAKPLVPLSV